MSNAILNGLRKIGSFSQETASSISNNSDIKDLTGYAIGGPVYGTLKEIKELIPDSIKDGLSFSRQKKQNKIAENNQSGRKRDSKGRYINSDSVNTARRQIAQNEILQDQLEFDEREAVREEKRHKELVRAVRNNKPGLLDKIFDRRPYRKTVIKEKSDGKTYAKHGRQSRDIDITGGDRNNKKSTANVKNSIRNAAGTGRAGLLGKAGNLAKGAMATGVRAGGGLLRALPGIGQVIARGMAGYDGFKGWNDKELQQKAFDLKDGQEASTGQKASAAAASILDMGGLTSGLLEMFGIEFDKADIAKNLYNFGANIGNIAQSFLDTAGPLLNTVWTGISELSGKIWNGAKDIGGAISGFAENVIAKGGEILSNLWKNITELPGKLIDGAKNFASNTIDKGGKLLSDGWNYLFGTDEAKAAENHAETNISQKNQEKDSKISQAISPMPVKNETKLLSQTQIQAADQSATSSEQAAGAKAIEQINQNTRENTNQQEMLDCLAELNEAAKKISKLLEDEFKKDDLPDQFGIAGAMDSMANAIQNMRTAGNNNNNVFSKKSADNTVFAYNPDSKIGDTIAHEESGNEGVNKIGYDGTGGTSYGKWQLASKTGSYENWLKLLQQKGGKAAEIASQLRAAGPANTGGSNGQHVEIYKKLATENAQLFEDTQRESLLRGNYSPAMKSLKSDSLRKMIESDKSLQEMMFSTSVQHGGGGAGKIFNKVYRDGMSREDLIRAVYADRGQYFGSSTPQIQQSVNRRFQREAQLILGMKQGEANISAVRAKIAEGGSGAVDAGMSSMVAAATQDAINRNVKYNFGLKSSEQGEIDCSGWVAEINRRMMINMNQAMGAEVFSKDAQAALKKGASEGAAGIIKTVGEKTGKIYDNAELAPENVREGMAIGMSLGSHAKGRFRNIGHIVQTYRDPETGEMMVSESSSGKNGVTKSKYSDWYSIYQKRGVALHGVDMAALADAGKIKPAQTASAAGSQIPSQIQALQAQTPQQQIQITENTIPSSVLAQKTVSNAGAVSEPPRSLMAQSQVMAQMPQNAANMASQPFALSVRQIQMPDAIRDIDPARESRPGGNDSSAIVKLLGQILIAIESGNKKAADPVFGSRRSDAPSISMIYDDPALQGMALDML